MSDWERYGHTGQNGLTRIRESIGVDRAGKTQYIKVCECIGPHAAENAKLICDIKNKVGGWERITDDNLPELDEPVFLYDERTGQRWTGCRSYVADAYGWKWCKNWSMIWAKGDGWDCDAEWDIDYTPTHFHRFPGPPNS